MIKLGILDFDTSHVVAFTERLNGKHKDKEQWVKGAKVVVACPGMSKIMPERIPGYTKRMKDLGVPLVEKPEQMIGKVDGMLIESQQGSMHYQRAKPFLEKGIPCFIDKPFTGSYADAKKIAALSAKWKAPVFTSSSLRYAPDLVKYAKDARHGKIEGAIAWSPASLHDGNPGLYHYGIHGVEILYTLMGPGCERVTCLHEKGVDVVTGHWKDGRAATFRGLRAGAKGYGFTAFAQRGIAHVAIGTGQIYRELLKKIVQFFETGKAPVPLSESVEMMGFIEAAYKSGMNHGSVMSING